MRNFILSCESTVDLPYAYLEKRQLPVLFYTYSVKGTEYTDDLGKDPQSLPRFYRMLADGAIPTTSQINTFRYKEFFEELLREGDVIHVTLSSGITGSYTNAAAAAEELRAEYPDRKITVIDSLGACSGYGILVDVAADMRDAGKSFEETEKWLLDNRLHMHYQFYSTTMDYFKRSGRVSGPAATIATILKIFPLMRFNAEGRIIAYEKVRGIKNVIRKTAEAMAEHADGGREYSGRCSIAHSNCIEDAEELRNIIAKEFHNLKRSDIAIYDIGTIITSHTGPGTLALFFFGDERTM
ncbi:MAG: DegV family protein [Ruminiclostridium sp.]|nr:DegV family protein [Ruminiclostridium sp.]